MNLEEGYSFWEDEKEKGKPPPQEQAFLSPPPYNHHRRGGGWPPEASHSHVAGEPSSSRFNPMTSVENNSSLATGEEEPGKAAPPVVEREHMFDKAVTPSDVGKLNRLVIPKQHAERYFPLDSATNDKGLLLNFEDRNGKLWRFRYSYWNSSQSYVMTKGWSRFVKEKKLDAGDIVSFQRGVGVTGKDRLFIDWRRRLDTAVNPPLSSNLSFPLIHHQNVSFHNRMNGGFNTHPWNPLILQSHPWRNPNLMLPPTTSRGGPYGGVVSKNGSSRSVIYFGSDGCRTPQQQQIQMMQMQQRRGLGLGFGIGIDPPPPPPAAAAAAAVAASGKRSLRLFGVNMDCAIAEEDDPPSYQLNPTTITDCDHNPSPPQIPPPSSSSYSTIPYLQLRPYDQGGTECNQSTILSSSDSASGDHAFKMFPKSTTSNMSLDLDI